MEIKGYSTFSESPRLKPPHYMVSCLYPGNSLVVGRVFFNPLPGGSGCILQP